MGKSKIMVLAAVLLASVATGCGGGDNSTEDAGDVPRCTAHNQATGNCADTSDPRSIGMPNTFPNVATKCDGFGHRVYTTTDRTLLVIADPTCPGYTDRTPDMGLVQTQGGR